MVSAILSDRNSRAQVDSSRTGVRTNEWLCEATGGRGWTERIVRSRLSVWIGLGLHSLLSSRRADRDRNENYTELWNWHFQR